MTNTAADLKDVGQKVDNIPDFRINEVHNWTLLLLYFTAHEPMSCFERISIEIGSPRQIHRMKLWSVFQLTVFVREGLEKIKTGSVVCA